MEAEKTEAVGNPRVEVERRIAGLCRRVVAGEVRERDVRHRLRDLERQLAAARRSEQKARGKLMPAREQLRLNLTART